MLQNVISNFEKIGRLFMDTSLLFQIRGTPNTQSDKIQWKFIVFSVYDLALPAIPLLTCDKTDSKIQNTSQSPYESIDDNEKETHEASMEIEDSTQIDPDSEKKSTALDVINAAQTKTDDSVNKTTSRAAKRRLKKIQ